MARIRRLWLLVAAAAAMEQYNVEVDVTLSSGKTGKFVVEVHPDWAPLGAAHVTSTPCARLAS